MKRLILPALIGVLALFAGCGQAPADDAAGTVYFAPLENEQLEIQTVPAPEPPSGEEAAQLEQVIDGFAQNAAVLFKRDDIDARLPQIEQLFITSGHYLDLVGIYQNVLETQGISSPAAPRLVRHYLRLGQRHLARDLLDRMIEQRRDEPQTWFLNGAYWLPELDGSQKASAHVVVSWQKALELDPNFAGFEQPDAPPIRQQLAALRRRASKEAIEKATAELGDTAEKPAPAEEQAPAEADGPEADEQRQEEAVAETRQTPPQAADSTSQAQAAASPSPEEPSTPEPAAVTIARGDMALAQGDAEAAEKLFEEALERDPANVDARLGQIRSGWADEARRNALATSLRKLAERDGLSPRQQYDIGRFAFSKMQDHRLAAELWSAAKKRDPDLAETVGLDKLIERASR